MLFIALAASIVFPNTEECDGGGDGDDDGALLSSSVRSKSRIPPEVLPRLPEREGLKCGTATLSGESTVELEPHIVSGRRMAMAVINRMTIITIVMWGGWVCYLL